MFHSKLTGVTFENEDGKSIQKILKKLSKEKYEGEEITLERNHDLPGHQNAIKAYSKNGDHIGHIKSEVAAEIAPLIDNGTPVRAFCSEITGGGSLLFGCNIEIYIGDEAESTPEDKADKIIHTITIIMIILAFGGAFLFFEWLF